MPRRRVDQPALVLLLFSVIVAVLGIINTSALSVCEPTREIGLLRVMLRMRDGSRRCAVAASRKARLAACLGRRQGRSWSALVPVTEHHVELGIEVAGDPECHLQ